MVGPGFFFAERDIPSRGHRLLLVSADGIAKRYVSPVQLVGSGIDGFGWLASIQLLVLCCKLDLRYGTVYRLELLR